MPPPSTMTERCSQSQDGGRTPAATERREPNTDDGIVDRAQMISAIERMEARIRELDAERSAEIARLDALRARFAAHDAKPQVAKDSRRLLLAPKAPRSGAEKLQIFRELFRGRLDVYPTRIR
jgi:hypothetical protein